MLLLPFSLIDTLELNHVPCLIWWVLCRLARRKQALRKAFLSTLSSPDKISAVTCRPLLHAPSATSHECTVHNHIPCTWESAECSWLYSLFKTHIDRQSLAVNGAHWSDISRRHGKKLRQFFCIITMTCRSLESVVMPLWLHFLSGEDESPVLKMTPIETRLTSRMAGLLLPVPQARLLFPEVWLISLISHLIGECGSDHRKTQTGGRKWLKE